MARLMDELGLDRLSAEDRLRLLDELWDSLTPEDDPEIPAWHRDELARRLEAAKDPKNFLTWEEAKTRLKEVR
ncbi:MAG: addiction module protein [Planctomycetia bacterium]